MIHPYVTIGEDTEVVYYDANDNGEIKVYIEQAVYGGFHHITFYLPSYKVEETHGFTADEVKHWTEFVHNNAHLIIESERNGGIFADAAAI